MARLIEENSRVRIAGKFGTVTAVYMSDDYPKHWTARVDWDLGGCLRLSVRTLETCMGVEVL